LSQLPKSTDPRVLVGTETADDAGVYQLNEETALVQTVDFFTPMVDDPYTFGQIAAANSLSDVYSMGGKPLTALNIVGFPFCSLSAEVLAEILRGGQAKAAEAGVAILGGHTIQDKEPKYGLSVTGIVAPQAIYSNTQAKDGDYLILTKPIGTGVVTTAAKAGIVSAEVLAAAIQSMVALNAVPAAAMCAVGCHSCTDITGFGLVGHANEMAAGSGVTLEIYAQSVPLLASAEEYASMGLVPAGAYANRATLAPYVNWDSSIPEAMKDLFYDPQTSGGLLISVPPARVEALIGRLARSWELPFAVIGRVYPAGDHRIKIHDGKMSIF
jgi:selenide,water dikinase